MPENNYIGSATSRTNIGTSTTTVYVTVPKLRFFMEPRALSFAPAQSISVPSIPKPVSSTLPKDIGLLSQLVKAPNPMTVLLMGLFYSPSVGDATLDRIVIGRPFEKRSIVGGFSRSASTVSTYDYTSEAFLREIAAAKSTVTTRVRFRVIEDEKSGNPKIVGYAVDELSGLDRVRVRFAERHEDGSVTFSDPDFKGQFIWNTQNNTAEYNDYTAQDVAKNPDLAFQAVKFSLDNGQRGSVIHDGGGVGDYLPPTPLPEPQKIWSLPNPILEPSKGWIETFPMPEQSTGWIESLPIHETDFNDYVIVDPLGEVPAIYVFFQKEPVDDLEVDYYENFKGRSREGLYEIDHIPSKAAVRLYLKNKYPTLTETQLDKMVNQVASIAIPKDVHQKCSETYGGRNNSKIVLNDGTLLPRKELDAKNLREAVERNWEANRECLENEGYDSKLLNEKLDKIHELNEAKGLYK
ncbi:S-type pyocin domain-containing protein [Providencia rettgeri]|uniref:S-type pyocin domain-containing protein n=1 Tax=Providencia rettgeri TaxID=587 RepID=UPI001EE757E6|nr:S-type pyocin domain-containing protein [Providencia rettgeri]MCG5371209.1 S-type pyocin domain-containing protein [Providencia rettgeri]